MIRLMEPKLLEVENYDRKIKKRLEDEKTLAQMSIVDFAHDSKRLTPQKRGCLWEKYLISRGYFERKVRKKEKCGDLYKQGCYYELKTRYFENKDKLFSGGQVRLYQPLDFYLFITVLSSRLQKTVEVFMLLIPAIKLKEHYQHGDIPFSSCHIEGTSQNKQTEIHKLKSKREWSVTLSNDTFNWNNYAIEEKQLCTS